MVILGDSAMKVLKTLNKFIGTGFLLFAIFATYGLILAIISDGITINTIKGIFGILLFLLCAYVLLFNKLLK